MNEQTIKIVSFFVGLDSIESDQSTKAMSEMSHKRKRHETWKVQITKSYQEKNIVRDSVRFLK